jgi:glutamyl-tRNA reductase
MIASEVDRFGLQLRTRDAAPTIRQLRHHAEEARRHTLEQARHMLAAGRSPDEVLEFLSATLTNRLIHAPSQRLRDAAETGDDSVIQTIAGIYHLDRD